MERLFIYEKNIVNNKTDIKELEKFVHINFMNIDKNVRLGVCREDGSILIAPEYNNISIDKNTNFTCIECERYLYDVFHEKLIISSSKYQKTVWNCMESKRERFIEVRRFILYQQGEMKTEDCYEIYETEESAPYLSKEWVEMSKYLTWNKINFITEDAEDDRKIFNSTSKLMFCQNIVRLFWISRLDVKKLKYMYCCFWEINAIADFISDKHNLEWKEKFYNRLRSTMEWSGKSYENPEFVQWKEKVIKHIYFFLMDIHTNSDRIRSEMKVCLDSIEFDLLSGWYKEKELQWKEAENQEQKENIIGMELRHVSKDGRCDSIRSLMVQSLFNEECWSL